MQSRAGDDTLVKKNEVFKSKRLIVTKTLWGHTSPTSRTSVKKKEWLIKGQKKGST